LIGELLVCREDFMLLTRVLDSLVWKKVFDVTP